MIAFDKVLLDLSVDFTSTYYDFTLASGGAAAGNLVVIGLYNTNSSGDVTGVTDSKGNTYTLSATPLAQTIQGDVKTVMAYSILDTALVNGDTITVTLSASEYMVVNIVAVSYSGLGATPVDQQGAVKDDTFPQTQPVGSSLTTTEADELLVSWIVSANIGTATATANWTARASSPGVTVPNYLFEDRIVSSTGTYNSAPTWSADDYWNAHTMTFKTGVTLDTVLPDGDITTSGWSTAPLYSKINDSSDATVITATAS